MSEMFPDVESMMTPEQRAKIGQPKAWENTQRVLGFPLGATPFQMTGHFHTVCGIPTPDAPIVPPVSLRIQRARFILEEFLELLEGMGLELHLDGSRIPADHASFTIEHIEGSRYDVVETADALGDLNVVVNGTGVEFGIPMHFIDYEVYCSNLSKVPPSGEPIRNGITEGYRAGEPGHRPDAPDGKILKPESFVPCNIPAVLVAFERKEF